MAKLTQTLSLERGSTSNGAEGCFRDPSFSSYLSGIEDCFVINFSKKSLDPGDMESDVFRAEKYFNETLEAEKPKVIKLAPVQDLVSGSTTKALSGASSVRTVSSWNSQRALLRPELRNPSFNGPSTVKERSYLDSFRCRCVCADKNSVAVDEYQSCSEFLRLTQKAAKEKVVSSTAERQCMAKQGLNRETYLISNNLSVEDLAMKPRKSLDIFGAPLMQRGNKPFRFEMERKLTLNREDSLSRQPQIVIPAVAKIAYAESDSDSSSDLFEIEEFSSKGNPFVPRIMSDSTMPTAYAPSEASIEWSVVTASAADFPVTSNYDELRPIKNTTNSKTTSKGLNQKGKENSGKPRRLSSSFMACNNQNSVNVFTHAQKIKEKKAETKICKSQDILMPVYSAQTEANLTRFETALND